LNSAVDCRYVGWTVEISLTGKIGKKRATKPIFSHISSVSFIHIGLSVSRFQPAQTTPNRAMPNRLQCSGLIASEQPGLAYKLTGNARRVMLAQHKVETFLLTNNH